MKGIYSIYIYIHTQSVIVNVQNNKQIKHIERNENDPDRTKSDVGIV